MPETHRRPNCLIRDLSKTHRTPRHASSETKMPTWRPVGEDMPVETHRQPTSLWSLLKIQTHLFKYTYFYIIFSFLNGNNVRILIRHVSLWFYIYVGLQPRMSVSNESPMGHVGLQWVSDEACRDFRSDMLVSDKACPCLQWFSHQACRLSVSDGSPIGLLKSSIFVNSFHIITWRSKLCSKFKM